MNVFELNLPDDRLTKRIALEIGQTNDFRGPNFESLLTDEQLIEWGENPDVRNTYGAGMSLAIDNCTRVDVMREIGQLLGLCHRFDINPIEALSRYFPRYKWQFFDYTLDDDFLWAKADFAWLAGFNVVTATDPNRSQPLRVGCCDSGRVLQEAGFNVIDAD